MKNDSFFMIVVYIVFMKVECEDFGVLWLMDLDDLFCCSCKVEFIFEIEMPKAIFTVIFLYVGFRDYFFGG